MDFGPHAGFIVAAYAIAAVVIAALISWVAIDYRMLRRLLVDMEARGMTRRSQRPTADIP
ncbi:MAG TPA: heme exporter protein CcmD [Bradyrhizobium sp.]|nr:heme exporter protein CcmD [Bradyrhizobium sp.]